MDQWLAMNRKTSWFELNLGGGHNRYTITTPLATGTTSTDGESHSYHADMYISFFNAYGEYELTNDNLQSYAGAAGLRLLGASSQTTNLVARYGWRRLRDMDTKENWENQFAEGVLQMYLVPAMGVQGKYRHYLKAKSNLGNQLEVVRVIGRV